MRKGRERHSVGPISGEAGMVGGKEKIYEQKEEGCN